jgi:tetratricopeptide (TPR) repeat protein
MKAKCPECGVGKARRLCPRVGHVEICSACCASIRDPDCGDCPHYAAAARYEAGRQRSGHGLSAGHFLMEIDPEVSAAVDRALESAERGDLGRPMETLTELFRRHPRQHDVVYGIGVVHAMGDRYRESIEWFDRAIEVYPYSLEAHFNRAISLQRLLDLKGCIRGFRKVIELGPVDDSVVAQARQQLDFTAEAIRENEGASIDDFLRSGDKFDEGFALMESGDWNGAVEAFRASAAIHDHNAPCHGNTGLCLAYLGRKAEALAELDRALEIDPEYDPARDNRRIIEDMSEGRLLALEGVGHKTIEFGREQLDRQGSGPPDRPADRP